MSDPTTPSLTITMAVIILGLSLALMADATRRHDRFCRFNAEDAACTHADIPPATFE